MLKFMVWVFFRFVVFFVLVRGFLVVFGVFVCVVCCVVFVVGW